jgi:hypothetical protein
MKKEIKDFIHLHLGCECETKVKYPSGGTSNVKAVFVGIDRLSVDTSYTTRPFDIYGKPWDHFHETKEAPIPILRELSSMTEADSLKIFGVKNKWKLFTEERTDKTFDAPDRWLFTPNETVELLKLSFDIYGLLESGLAIEAKETVSQ